MPRFHLKVVTRDPQEDLASLGRAELEAEHASESHIDVFVDADEPEGARQQVSEALGGREDDDFVQTERAND